MGTSERSQESAKSQLVRQLQDQVTLWRSKYEALANLYNQLRTEHLDMLHKYRDMQLKVDSTRGLAEQRKQAKRDTQAHDFSKQETCMLHYDQHIQ